MLPSGPMTRMACGLLPSAVRWLFCACALREVRRLLRGRRSVSRRARDGVIRSLPSVWRRASYARARKALMPLKQFSKPRAHPLVRPFPALRYAAGSDKAKPFFSETCSHLSKRSMLFGMTKRVEQLMKRAEGALGLAFQHLDAAGSIARKLDAETIKRSSDSNFVELLIIREVIDRVGRICNAAFIADARAVGPLPFPPRDRIAWLSAQWRAKGRGSKPRLPPKRKR